MADAGLFPILQLVKNLNHEKKLCERREKRSHYDKIYQDLKQQITEHQFGTLKRQRGFTYTLVRKKYNVLGEVRLIFIGYNLSRCVNILGVKELIKALNKMCLPLFSVISGLFLRRFYESRLGDQIFLHQHKISLELIKIAYRA